MKMKNVFYSIMMMLFLVVSSCKKEDPKPATATLIGTPVFSFAGTINGSPIAIQAGENDYFMSTSYSLDENGVYDFAGELKPKNCTNCGSSLKISIKDYHPLSISKTTIDSSITTGFYGFSAPLGGYSQYSNVFVGVLQNGIAQTYAWDFGDGTSTTTISSPTIIHKYVHPGIYKVSLTIQSTNGCTSTIENEIQFGPIGNSFLPQFQTSVKGDSVTLIPIAFGGIPPFTYFWNFGDGSTSTAISPSHKYANDGVYKASLSMTDAMGNSGTQYLNVPINASSYNSCSALFIFPSSTPVANPLNLGTVEIQWTDEDGRIWTSKSVSQSSSKSLFKIISVTDYSTNLNGDPTKKIHVKFSCTLYNGLRSMVMNNVDAVFSVSYK